MGDAEAGTLTLEGVVSTVEGRLGAPRHYGPTPAEAEELARADAARAARLAAETAAVEVRGGPRGFWPVLSWPLAFSSWFAGVPR